MRTFTLLFVSVLTVLIRSASAAEPRPNVVVFLADDLGFMDIGANNPEAFYETPNIEALARRGVRFTSGYAACRVARPRAPRC